MTELRTEVEDAKRRGYWAIAVKVEELEKLLAQVEAAERSARAWQEQALELAGALNVEAMQ